METLGGPEFLVIAMMGALLCLLPLALMLLVALPVVIWRRFILNRRRRGTIEGDVAHLVSEHRERLETSDGAPGGAKTPKWVKAALRDNPGGPQGPILGR